jgi:ABC-type phosphate transport system substrate-binding protein
MKNIHTIAFSMLLSIFTLSLCAEIIEKNTEDAPISTKRVRIACATGCNSFINMAAEAYSQADASIRVSIVRSLPLTALGMLDRKEVDIVIIDTPTDLTPVLTLLKPFAAAVNKKNPIDSISMVELKRIFNGDMKLWPDNQPVKLISAKAETEEAMLLESIFGVPVATSPLAVITDSGRGVAALIAVNPDATGCFPLEYYDRKVKMLKVDGVFPGEKEICSGKYKLVAEIKILSGDSPTLPVRGFIDFLKGKNAGHIYKYLSLYIKSTKSQEQ